jgi:hypothetical protein
MTSVILLLVLIALPFVVGVVRARWICASIGLDRQISDVLAEIDFERWEQGR